jgi:hypothetical protein
VRFLNLFKRHEAQTFANIEGYEDIKLIINRVLDTEDNYNLLLIGSPASSKTLFLLGILESRNSSQ